MTEHPVGVSDLAPAAGVAGYRTRARTVAGNSVHEQYLILQRERVLSFVGMVGTPAGGVPSSTLVIQTISNAVGSSVLVAVRSAMLSINSATDAVITAIYDNRLRWQAAIPTLGNVLTKASAGTGADTVETSNASVELRSRYALDGGASTNITLTVGTQVANLPKSRFHTNIGQARSSDGTVPDSGKAHELLLDGPIILRAGESLALQSVGGAPVEYQAHMNWLWEEYTLP